MNQALPLAIIAASYALLLGGAAAGLEAVARYSHRRARQYEHAGFEYQAEADTWRCPAGQHLRRQRSDHPRGRALYKAPAHVCNGCPAKSECTDSDSGRELEAKPDLWIDSTMARFHRSLSLMLLLLAELILAAAIIRLGAHGGVAAWILGGLMAVLGVVGLRLSEGFFAKE